MITLSADEGQVITWKGVLPFRVPTLRLGIRVDAEACQALVISLLPWGVEVGICGVLRPLDALLASLRLGIYNVNRGNRDRWTTWFT